MDSKSSKYLVLLLLVSAVAASGCITPDNSNQPAENENNTSTEEDQSADFEVINSSITPSSGEAPLNITGRITVQNNGGSEGIFTADLEVDGIAEEFTDVTVQSGEEETIQLNTTLNQSGEYSVELFGYNAANTGEVESVAAENVSVSEPELANG